jgi:hypothetical protein
LLCRRRDARRAAQQGQEPRQIDRQQQPVQHGDRHQVQARRIDDERNVAEERRDAQRQHSVLIEGQKHQRGRNVTDEIVDGHAVIFTRLVTESFSRLSDAG